MEFSKYFNRCKYRNCQQMFDTIDELIVHVETDHIDFNKSVMDAVEARKPQLIPMSYVLKHTRATNPNIQVPMAGSSMNTTNPFLKNNISNQPNLGTSAHYMENPSQNEDRFANPERNITKVYTCPAGFCKKEYRSRSSYRSHILKHQMFEGICISDSSPYVCDCGKIYKTLRGLKQHKLTHVSRANASTENNENTESSDEGARSSKVFVFSNKK